MYFTPHTQPTPTRPGRLCVLDTQTLKLLCTLSFRYSIWLTTVMHKLNLNAIDYTNDNRLVSPCSCNGGIHLREVIDYLQVPHSTLNFNCEFVNNILSLWSCYLLGKFLQPFVQLQPLKRSCFQPGQALLVGCFHCTGRHISCHRYSRAGVTMGTRVCGCHALLHEDLPQGKLHIGNIACRGVGVGGG